MDDSYIIAIDLGTAYSGYAYNITPKNKELSPRVKRWGTEQGLDTPKAPNCILFDEGQRFMHFGYQARDAYIQMSSSEAEKCYLFDNFKMSLYGERVEVDIVTQLHSFHRLVASEREEQTTQNPESDEEQSSREAVLNITLDLLRKNDQEHLAERLSSKSTDVVCHNKLKIHLQKRFTQVFEGVAKTDSPAPLSNIYTELRVTEGGASEVNQEHEVRHIESISRTSADIPASFEEIFKQGPKSGELKRTVLTKGVAGVGKTVLTQKFCLDWAEGRASQNIQLLFPFTFRELNVLRHTEYSLLGLLHQFFSQTKELSSLEHLKVLFIFDGLDECRLSLDFNKTKALTNPTENVSVEELLVNLIRGNLLPFAHLWITTRPAAANQIPAQYISMVTEVRGFTDPQKDHYFRKRFTDDQQASAVISHIKSIRSLYIMSCIPIFCWILSTVFLHLMESAATELPSTLTQMYIHFLLVQGKVKDIKYDEGTGGDHHWSPEMIEMVRSLGKLAFEQLQKGNLIFYESDLKDCGLHAAEIACYSGVFTEIFREEPGLYPDKVYCFIHLSVQEFLAALHVHQTFFSSRKNLLSTRYRSTWFDAAFYCSAVDQALLSPNGHLDLFLRFLLGLSLPSNWRLLPGLLSDTGCSLQTNERTIEYIKEKLNEKGVSAERSLNLLHCLNELNDRSLVKETQKVMRGDGLYHKRMSPAEWSAVSFLLLSSDSDLKEFDLRKYCPSEEALKSLMPVVKASNKAILICCNLSERSCGPLASVLSSSSLTLLDVSNNDLWDSGVERLCEGMKCSPCRLETLRLSGCLVSERGGASLVSALSSALIHLRELDLSYNHPGASIEGLTAQWAPRGPQQSLRLQPAGEKWLTPGLKKYFCELSLDPNTANRRLRLSDNNRTVTFTEEEQLYPYHQHRFDSSPQILCSNALTGQSYWEVVLDMNLDMNESVSVALSYIGITSKEAGKNSELGGNKESWALRISRESYCVSHDGKEFTLSYSPHFYRTANSSHYDDCFRNRVAVYLDYTGGSLSFFENTEGRKTLLYTYHTSFTQPLFAGFRVNSGSVSLVENV